MNYNGNMPDWHQYNPTQSGINDVTSSAQNVNAGHLSYISSISPTQLNNLNLASNRLEKHHNDPNFNSRHFQTHLSNNISHGHNATDNTPLASMVQMQNCIGPYGSTNTRNSLVENLNGPVDPRNTAVGLNEELGYRNNQVPFNGPITHLNGPNMMNNPHGSVGLRNTNVTSHATNRTGPPSFVSCKGLCCNPDSNIGYQQWEKYCSYQNNTTYRENIRPSGYQTDTRRFGSDFNFRKDNFDGKEILSSMVPNAPNADHRRNLTDFKYRKDRMVSRNYQPSSGMLQNYPMQNYNYTGEYQKYPYSKEYPKVNSMNIPNQGMVKHQEQNFMPQQKYNNKQASYQNSGMISNSAPSTNVHNPNVISSTQNTYFTPQYPRNVSRETSHDCQEATDNSSMVNRIQTSTMHAPHHSRYQIYQQKIAMQRFSMENHLRELTRIPGYQSHPKYKECVLRYREILKLQQSVTYQGQIQQAPCVTTSPVNTSIPPINLQFDQNGVLINSNYIPEAFPRMQQVLNPQMPVDTSDKQNKQENNNIPEIVTHQKTEQISQTRDNHATALCSESLQKQEQYILQKTLDQNQFNVQKNGNESFNSLNTTMNNTTIEQKISKQFADKPELDVRQFLANWDESEDEDTANSNLPNVVLNNSTSVVVVGYKNVDLSTKTLENLEATKLEDISSNVIAFESQDKNNIGVMPAQNCLTVSYSSAENIEIAKGSCKNVAKENIVQPGSIIQCISNGPDEVPTIHIVDNLEINSILQVTNEQVAETLERQDAVPFFHEETTVEANSITLKTDKKAKESGIKYNTDLENLSKKVYIVENPCPPTTVENTLQSSQVNNQETTLSMCTKNNLDSTQDANLKKQISLTSEESHNPDDISLPDLPTSECTPISTTLNTPIHSDSEESSERVEDLTISTNPIEIIQNSPMISFTQSPVKEDPYNHLNDERNIKNKSTNTLEYQTEKHVKNDDASNNLLERDIVLNTFEFSTDIDKHASAISTETSKEHTSPNKNAISTNTEKVFSFDDKTENAEATGMCMTLTSGEYELKIVSTGIQTKSMQKYKNSTTECHINESQTDQTIHKRLLALPEINVKSTLESIELDNALRNIANNSNSKVEFNGSKSDINYVDMYETNLLKTKNEEKLCAISSVNDKKSTFTESASTNNTSKICKPAIEDSCSKIINNNPSTSYSIKCSTSSNKTKKNDLVASDKFAKKDLALEKAADNKSIKINTKDLKNARCTNLSQTKVENPNETIVHQNKYIEKSSDDKSFITEELKQTDILQSEQKTNDNDESRERMRFLKEYRKLKYKSSGINEGQNKSNDTQETSVYKINKKSNVPPNPVEQSVSQLINDTDKELSQKEVKSSKEEERNNPILTTFVTKNINPDFAIQVRNVNLKLKEKDQQKDSQHLKEEVENNGPLDAIKIEINVSCTERNTTEKLLHENIKNAVAETIGHLTSSISNGARSNSTSMIGKQCDKKIMYNNIDPRNHEEQSINNRSSSTLMESNENQGNVQFERKCAISVCKESILDDETSSSFITKKKKNSSSERKLTDKIYEDNDTSSKIVMNTCADSSASNATILQDNIFLNNINIVDESAPSALETSKSTHMMIRRKSVNQDSEMRITTPNFPLYINTEELKTSSDNPLCLESTKYKKGYREATTTRRNEKNSQDSVVPRLNFGPSTSSNVTNSAFGNVNYNNSAYFDYNHFDVAPNENASVDDRHFDKWKRSNREDGRFSNLHENASGYINPIFYNIDEMENLNAVPVYTTKDGKITYSPNPRFTYRELIVEAQAKENCADARGHFARSSSFDYYNFSKLRKLFKRNSDITTVSRKREVDCHKSSYATKHTDYLPKKSITYKSTYAKNRNLSPLEFFNDDADKLYTSKSNQQESKEANKKNIVDLSFLEKQYNLDNKATCNIKQCKTKIIADNIDCEKEYNESSIFDANLLLGSKATYCEETLESIKSYSSHIDRRNSNNIKLNFSEMFTTQKQSESKQQNIYDGNYNHKMNNCNKGKEESILPFTKSSYTNESLIQDDILQNNQSNITLHNEKENEDVKQNEMSATNMDNTQLSNEYVKKQESQHDRTEYNTVMLAEMIQASPKATDEKVYILENLQCPYIKDERIITEHAADNIHTVPFLEEDKSDVKNDSLKEVLDNDSNEVINVLKTDTTSKNSLNEHTETISKSESVLNKQIDGIKVDEIVEHNSYYSLNNEIISKQPSSLIDREDKETVLSVAKSYISTEICFDKTNHSNDAHNKEESVICKKEDNKIKLLKNIKEEQLVQDSRHEANDEVDNCSASSTSKQATLDLQMSRSEESKYDLFTNKTNEQNISEFTVIKSIIKSDKRQFEKLETNEDCSNIIDSKLLCLDSSDCGIYVEDRCALIQMSEHEHFIEEDSMVPMKWETSEIQDDAVNRLCNIDESSVEFTGTSNSLPSNLLLENLSLPNSVVKESEIPEMIPEIEINANKLSLAIKPVLLTNESKISQNDEKNEQTSSDNCEKITYLHTADCNANTKMVPKLVIKKTEANSKFITKMASSSSVVQTDNMTNKSTLNRPSPRPKIPKMIIRNARSRPGTPSIEAVPEEDSLQLNIPEWDLPSMHNEITKELYENGSVNSLQESVSSKNKIPKMKIRLDEKRSKKIVKATKDSVEFCVTHKVMEKIPKIKIKNSLRTEVSNNLICTRTNFQESKNSKKYEEKIPILKLKKQERNRSSSPEVVRKRQNSYHAEIPIKKCKKLKHDEAEHLTRHNNSDLNRTSIPECATKKNPLVCISKKIPKVIIKRTSASAEFKCELSKSCKNVITKSAKWQPEVKLERYRILDSMVKDLKLTMSHISLRDIDIDIFASHKNSYCQKKEGDHKLSRSNSTSDLLPMKYKQRRMSDYDYRKIISVSKDELNFISSQDTHSNDMCIMSKNNVCSKERSELSNEHQKEDKCSSKSDNNPQVEADVTLFGNKVNQSTIRKSTSKKIPSQCNEYEIDSCDTKHDKTTIAEDTSVSIKLDRISNKYLSSTSFKTALKELKETTKTDIHFLNFPSFSYPNSTSSEDIDLKINEERNKEWDDNSLLHLNEDKIVTTRKKHLNESLNDIDNENSLQDNIGLLKDDRVIILDNSEIDNSSVIKIESSDESQTTIEILPASPDRHNELDNHMDGDNEQLYPADAIPTQFELELEITDNSNIDLLDVPMPKLDSITCYSSRDMASKEYCNDEASKIVYSDKFESSSDIKTLHGNVKHMETDINDKPVLKNSLLNSTEKISLNSAECGENAKFTTMKENFCCNDLLIKEVLAAKETLKKCLSKSRCENSVKSLKRPKTVAEKKQGLSFDINNLSDKHCKSQKIPERCYNSKSIQKYPDSTIRKHNESEILANVEKSEKKYVKYSENISLKKKLKLIEMKDINDSTTISLKTFKRFNQTALNKNPNSPINLDQKRETNLADQSNISPQLQDSSEKGENNLSSCIIPKISKPIDQKTDVNSNGKEIKFKENNIMPILEPEIAVIFDANADSRDNSRSPPVITNQDSIDLDVVECKEICDEITTLECKIEVAKEAHKKSELTITDFVTQLAYHEKAIIKHKRYCNLCEKWFPTTSRHRRHLAGYQHRHIELTQRRSIHAMFMLFTGKPCPKLLPANVVRSDCSVGELTPLQIAVQDVTKCSDHTHESPMR